MVLVGNIGFSAGGTNTESLFVYNGAPYVAYEDGGNNNKATVMKYGCPVATTTNTPSITLTQTPDFTPTITQTSTITPTACNAVWQNIGSPGFSGTAVNTSLFVSNGMPYVAYEDNSNSGKGTVKYFNGNWTQESTTFSNGTAQYPSLYMSGGTPYVAFVDDANSSKAMVKKYNGSWSYLGGAVSDAGAQYTALCISSGIPYVAYSDSGNYGMVTVKSYTWAGSGGNWTLVGNRDFSMGAADYISLCVYNGTPYVAYEDMGDYYRTTVMKYNVNGLTWAYVGQPGFSKASVAFTSLGIDNNGTPYVAFVDSQVSDKASVMKYDVNGLTWAYLGTEGISPGPVAYTSMFMSGNTPYVAFQDETTGNSNKETVMKYDVNGLTWAYVGSQDFSAGGTQYSSLFVYNGVPYVAYQDAFNNYGATVMKFDCPQPTMTITPDYSATITLTSTPTPSTTPDFTLTITQTSTPTFTSTITLTLTDTTTLTPAYSPTNTPTPCFMTWQNVGIPAFSNGRADYTSLFVYGSAPYVAYEDSNGKATVMTYNGVTWTPVGKAGFSADSAPYISLFIDNGTGTPYVAYYDGNSSGRATVMDYAGGSGYNNTGWSFVGTAGFSAGEANYTSLYVYSNTPYVAYSDWAYSERASVMTYNGVSWTAYGTQGFSAGPALYTSLCLDNTGTPYVAFSDYGNGYNGNASVMKFDTNGLTWAYVGNEGFSAGGTAFTSLYISGGTPYIAYQDLANSNRATVMTYTGVSWTAVGSAGFSNSNGAVQYTSLSISNGTPYLAYQDVTNSNAATVMTYNGVSWTALGKTDFSPGGANYTSLFVNNGIPYVAYQDVQNNNYASLMKFDCGSSNTPTLTITMTPTITITATPAQTITPLTNMSLWSNRTVGTGNLGSYYDRYLHTGAWMKFGNNYRSVFLTGEVI